MKKLLKPLAVGLGCAVIVSGFAGCGNGDTAGTDGEKPTLTYLMPYVKQDPNTYPTATMLEEKTGYHVEYTMLPQDNPGEKLNLMMASKEPYDIIVTKSDLRVNWADYVKQGALLELTELLDTYGPNIKNAMSETSFDLMRVNGELYGIPTPALTTAPVFSYSNMLTVRQDLLDQYGIAMPKTIDEFTETLRQLKANVQLENNQEFAPLSIGTTIEIPGVVGAFGVPNPWNEVDGKLVHRVEDPRYLEYIKYLASLYQEGLLDREFPTNKTATLTEKFSSGRAGMITSYYWDMGTLLDALNQNLPDATTSFVEALTGPNGDRGIGRGADSSALDRLTYIPKSAEHPEDAMKYMNMKLADDLFIELAIGEEGKHYTVENGEYMPIIPIFFDECSMANEYLTGVNEETYPKYWQARVRKDQRVYDSYKFMFLDEERYSVAVQDPLMYAPVFESDANKKILDQLANDYFIKVIAGEEDLDASYDAFLANWKAEGGEEMVKEVNEWYAAQ